MHSFGSVWLKVIRAVVLLSNRVDFGFHDAFLETKSFMLYCVAVASGNDKVNLLPFPGVLST